MVSPMLGGLIGGFFEGLNNRRDAEAEVKREVDMHRQKVATETDARMKAAILEDAAKRKAQRDEMEYINAEMLRLDKLNIPDTDKALLMAKGDPNAIGDYLSLFEARRNQGKQARINQGRSAAGLEAGAPESSPTATPPAPTSEFNVPWNGSQNTSQTPAPEVPAFTGGEGMGTMDDLLANANGDGQYAYDPKTDKFMSQTEFAQAMGEGAPPEATSTTMAPMLAIPEYMQRKSAVNATALKAAEDLQRLSPDDAAGRQAIKDQLDTAVKAIKENSLIPEELRAKYYDGLLSSMGIGTGEKATEGAQSMSAMRSYQPALTKAITTVSKEGIATGPVAGLLSKPRSYASDLNLYPAEYARALRALDNQSIREGIASLRDVGGSDTEKEYTRVLPTTTSSFKDVTELYDAYNRTFIFLNYKQSNSTLVAESFKNGRNIEDTVIAQKAFEKAILSDAPSQDSFDVYATEPEVIDGIARAYSFYEPEDAAMIGKEFAGSTISMATIALARGMNGEAGFADLAEIYGGEDKARQFIEEVRKYTY